MKIIKHEDNAKVVELHERLEESMGALTCIPNTPSFVEPGSLEEIAITELKDKFNYIAIKANMKTNHVLAAAMFFVDSMILHILAEHGDIVADSAETVN